MKPKFQMKFNIEDYDHTYVMHCKNEHEATTFMKYLDDYDRKWSTIKLASADNKWTPRGGGTCYRFNAHRDGRFGLMTWDLFENYSNKDSVEVYGYQPIILEFDEFDWGKDATPDTMNISFEQIMGL